MEIDELERKFEHLSEQYAELKELFLQGFHSGDDHDLDEWEKKVSKFFAKEVDPNQYFKRNMRT